ncbi:sce7726 family protein [Amphritea sp.]|uniref:sce7726 family protein n=1 Tax=Amphritea sp. TaxID=1872502 RepID=UPI0025B85480|nr:sce7726 family protein [Amphritea sp.]
MKELQIKTLLVEHLLRQCSDVILGAEVAFQYGSRRADIISITDNNIATAYEIKGANDSIDRLEYQVKSYKSYFDYCYIVCEPCNLSIIRKNIGREVGILVIHDEFIEHLRKSQRFKQHKKEYLASTLPIKELRKMTKHNHLRSKHELCEALSEEQTTHSIRAQSRKSLASKYRVQTSLLKRDVATKVTADDLLTISRSSPDDLKL